VSTENVTTTVESGILTIRIHRPEARNALTKAMYAAIRDATRDAYVDDAVDLVLIRGSEGAFAVGGDLKEMLGDLEAGGRGLFAYDECLPFEAVRSLPKPTVAVVDGLCIGGGLTLASVCDVVVATSRSKFAMPEARVGVVDAQMPRLFRSHVPPALLRYWLYSGASFGTDEAFAAGLLTKVVAPEELEATVDEVVANLRKGAPGAIRMYKKILNETRHVSSMEDALTTLFGPEAQERIAAFGQH
jgi:enoyl-CoA hydratase/carnithine racemase